MTATFLSPTGGATLGPRPSSLFWNNRLTHWHQGIDLNVHHGDLIIAPAAGTVVSVRYSIFGGGNIIDLDHGTIEGKLVKTSHMHNGHKKERPPVPFLVKLGEHVEAGQPIAYAGDSGNANGVHDHFQLSQAGRNVDPLPWLREYQYLIGGRTVGLIYQGSRGDMARLLQQRLSIAGFPPRTLTGKVAGIDGIFGVQTAKAVRLFQTFVGLYPDCIVGRKTWGKLLA
jgi:hypothetical protein